MVSLATLAHKFDDLGSAKAIIGSGPFVVTSEVLGKEDGVESPILERGLE